MNDVDFPDRDPSNGVRRASPSLRMPAGATVPMHITRCVPDAVSEAECHRMAGISCHLACVAVDAIRGRLERRHLVPLLDRGCLRRLETLEQLVDEHFARRKGLEKVLRHLPVIPLGLQATSAGKDHYEAAVHMLVGGMHCWANLVFTRTRGRWVCTVLDLG